MTFAGLPDRAWILAHIPHQGDMCLLDAVTAWDEARIRCTANGHRDPANPLRAGGRLGVMAGIEYAAQAMAVHGALLAGDAAPPAPGFLGSARGVDCLVDRLDDIDAPLDIEAERLSGDARTLLYGFTVSAAGRPLLRGRAAVVLGAASPSTS
ncbi:3-hydroxylacyl-ACP dehydratase [Thauera sp. CAU 1555]|uniref:3-hydroxylacyl-ACP dehydratase n=1 Tax=Thauera sedimentorum TaxID=2767595 RepID=A0ABR9BG25_9RHOO|nr:3-hydroxylacyl-ACP dehydratase [Thauera sedimentorum]MBC9073252.1 3-hydroxylacyl-ACP dehydratase [Thauera sedimentorum]MBD8504171.1 3-hydroxylacyl-ACP dehydratase [Thauera sedimentorum]